MIISVYYSSSLKCVTAAGVVIVRCAVCIKYAAFCLSGRDVP